MSPPPVSWALLRGGLRLEANKDRSTRNPIRVARVPEQLIVPIDQHAGDPAIPLVTVGDQVAMGQPIAKPASSISAWIHAPVSGRIIEIAERPDSKSNAPLRS